MTTVLLRAAALFLGLSCTFGAACDDTATDEKSDSGSEKGGDKAAAKPGDAEVTATARTFEKDQRKKGCEMLTPKIAAQTLGVPEGELRQMKVMGCIYTWKSADKSEIAEAAVMSIVVREDAEQARTHFDNATADKTAEEIRAELAKVMEMTKKREEIDTKTKEKTVSAVGGMVGAMVPEEGYKYTDLPGVGDAARASSEDGALTVLLGNMVFNVRAYKGKPSPPIDMAGISPTDTKAILAAAKVVEAKWKAETLDARKDQAAKVAKAVLESL